MHLCDFGHSLVKETEGCIHKEKGVGKTVKYLLILCYQVKNNCHPQTPAEGTIVWMCAQDIVFL